jgi:hypothetical protein
LRIGISWSLTRRGWGARVTMESRCMRRCRRPAGCPTTRPRGASTKEKARMS